MHYKTSYRAQHLPSSKIWENSQVFLNNIRMGDARIFRGNAMLFQGSGNIKVTASTGLCPESLSLTEQLLCLTLLIVRSLTCCSTIDQIFLKKPTGEQSHIELKCLKSSNAIVSYLLPLYSARMNTAPQDF